MVIVRQTKQPDEPPVDSTQALFQRQWQIYRKLVDHNYLYHREAYGWLRRIVGDEAVRPFRFLDVACGDAGPTVAALTGTPVAGYHGIDLSAAALELARPALAALGCPVTLELGDFAEVLLDRPSPADVVWIGLSLHHLQTPAKLDVMRAIRGIVGQHGLFLIYEATCPDGEDRADWLRRWDRQQPEWTAYTPAEWEALTAHVHAADFPETASRWLALGREAGFGTAREVYVTPSNIYRFYRFAA